jgi:hypothetical protein
MKRIRRGRLAFGELGQRAEREREREIERENGGRARGRKAPRKRASDSSWAENARDIILRCTAPKASKI